jgi:hypothetical protein
MYIIYLKKKVYMRYKIYSVNLVTKNGVFCSDFLMGFARGYPHSVLLAFSQSYIEHDLRKNKIVIPFFFFFFFFANRLIFIS